ncbi:unnamed protein product [Acanthoscelides obtectus]|uniref:Uncharacterized protein n=1 Tax=Acanthoscelides obtectus TaxID=200917 RepID=A0A9P0KST0_ACAOB|nr:unnamed protein product [Acanthoscelides obtectus]CAK1688547.1 hypothetical protein AOBTE_LOCUS36753 [Acanthoscelides obtectus]
MRQLRKASITSIQVLGMVMDRLRKYWESVWREFQGKHTTWLQRWEDMRRIHR